MILASGDSTVELFLLLPVTRFIIGMVIEEVGVFLFITTTTVVKVVLGTLRLGVLELARSLGLFSSRPVVTPGVSFFITRVTSMRGIIPRKVLFQSLGFSALDS